MAKYKTEQRKILFELFKNNPHKMFSANEIESAVSEKALSISAIYRNLSSLEKEGIVRRSTKNGSRKAYYQYTDADTCKEHIHLTCKKCGKTVHMELEDSDELVINTLKHENFFVDKADSVLLGFCGSCRKAQS